MIETHGNHHHPVVCSVPKNRTTDTMSCLSWWRGFAVHIVWTRLLIRFVYCILSISKYINVNAPAHYNDVIMGVMASQITSLTIVYSTVYSDADQRKQQSSASLAIVLGNHRWPVNSQHKWPVTRKMFPFDDVIRNLTSLVVVNPQIWNTQPFLSRIKEVEGLNCQYCLTAEGPNE